MEDIALCQKIEAELKEADIAHGDPKGRLKSVLWRISPRYFLISVDWWKKIKEIVDAFVRFYIRVKEPRTPKAIDEEIEEFIEYDRLRKKLRTHKKPKEPFYFRLDCTIATNNVPMVVEWNLVPVGDVGAEVNRRAYTKLIPIPPGYANPFPGNIAILADALRWYGGRVAIVIPYSRRHYTRDYKKTAKILREEKGVEIEVVNPRHLIFGNGILSDHKGKIDVIYRIFTRFEGPPNSLIANAIAKKAVRLFPPFSPLETKESMAWVFREYLGMYKTHWNREKLKRSELETLFKSLPWTWIADPEYLPEILDKKDFLPVSRREWAEFFSKEAWKEGFVLKSSAEFGGRNLVFSKDETIREWRRALLQSLIGCAKGKRKTIIQKMIELKRFPVSYLEGEEMVTTGSEWGTRLCVTGVWLPKKGTKIGDIDVALRPGRLIHQQADCVFVPTLIEKA